MSDLFISYSRKDSEQALALAERLRRNGIDVWIDQHGIEAATSWSKEIVHAIDESKAFMVMLSSNSMESENVAKELSLAAEARKKIVPIALEDIRLSDDFRYHLAGIQRVAYTQFDAITEALLGFGIKAKQEVRQNRKSLMILPFEDLSPTQDDGWFADGLVSEMIANLSKVKSLKLIDRQTSLQIKKKGHSIAELAEILEVRYFIEGSIRKFGEQIKIDAALLDFETGDYLWQDSHKGQFSDVFEMQEAIADKVLEGLRIHLASDEMLAVKRQLTENPEAYECYLKAQQEFSKYTVSGYERAIALNTEATRLDPELTVAFSNLAQSHFELHRTYERDTYHIEAAERAIQAVRQFEGESGRYLWGMSTLMRVKGDLAKAEELARQAIDHDPEYTLGYESLGFALQYQNRLEEAAMAWREYARRRFTTQGRLNLLIILSELEDQEALRTEAHQALPVFEKNLKLNPDDPIAAIAYANVLRYAGEKEEAIRRAHILSQDSALEGLALYNLACLFSALKQVEPALKALRRSVERNFSSVETIRRDHDLNPLRDTEEFKIICAELETKLAAQGEPPIIISDKHE